MHPYVAVSEIGVDIEGVEELRAAFERRLGAVDEWDGFLGLELLADRRRPGRYLMLSRWRSSEMFVEYMRSADHQASHAFATLSRVLAENLPDDVTRQPGRRLDAGAEASASLAAARGIHLERGTHYDT